MIEFKPEKAWVVISREPDDSMEAWAIRDTVEAAVGAAVQVITNTFDNRDFVIDAMQEDSERWIFRGRSTTNGYPDRQPVTLWVLPAERRAT